MGRRVTILGCMVLAGVMLVCGCIMPSATDREHLEQLPPADRILAIEMIGPQEAVTPGLLRHLLGDPSPIIRAQAAQLLAAHAAQGRPELALPALVHGDPMVRGIAQASYMEHNRYGLAPVVMNGHVEEASPRVLDALARLDNPAGRVDLDQVIAGRREALRSALEGEPQTAVLAADILARIGDAGARRRLLLLVESADGPVIPKAVRACVRASMGLGPTALPVAFGHDVEARRAVMRALVVAPDPRLQMLIRRGLKDGDTAVQRNAIRALGNLGAAAPINLLAERLSANNGATADVLRSLGVVGLPAVDVLRRYIRRNDTTPMLRVQAMMALAPNAGRADIPWATAGLTAKNTYIRAAAASVLGRIGHPEAQAALVAARNDPEPIVRASVSKALGQIGTIYAANHLLDLLNDPSPLVASMAAWGLGATGYPAAVPALAEMMTTHTSAASVPVHVGEMYGRPELAATEALGRIRSQDAQQALRQALERDDWRIRAAAAGALRVAADRSDDTIAALEKRLDDPVIIVQAKVLLALESLGKTYKAGAFQGD